MIRNSQNASKTWDEGRFLKDGREIGWMGLLSSYASGKVQWYLNHDKPIKISTFLSRFGHTPLVLTSGSYVTSTKRTSGLSATGGVLDVKAVGSTKDGWIGHHSQRGRCPSTISMAEFISLCQTTSLQVVDLVSDYMQLMDTTRGRFCFSNPPIGF